MEAFRRETRVVHGHKRAYLLAGPRLGTAPVLWLEQWGPFDLVAGPSGYGLPLVGASDCGEAPRPSSTERWSSRVSTAWSHAERS